MGVETGGGLGARSNAASPEPWAGREAGEGSQGLVGRREIRPDPRADPRAPCELQRGGGGAAGSPRVCTAPSQGSQGPEQ